MLVLSSFIFCSHQSGYGRPLLIDACPVDSGGPLSSSRSSAVTSCGPLRSSPNYIPLSSRNDPTSERSSSTSKAQARPDAGGRWKESDSGEVGRDGPGERDIDDLWIVQTPYSSFTIAGVWGEIQWVHVIASRRLFAAVTISKWEAQRDMIESHAGAAIEKGGSLDAPATAFGQAVAQGIARLD